MSSPEQYWKRVLQGKIHKSFSPNFGKFYSTGCLSWEYLLHHNTQIQTIFLLLKSAASHVSSPLLDVLAGCLFAHCDLLMGCSLDYACIHSQRVYQTLQRTLRNIQQHNASGSTSVSQNENERYTRELWILEQILSAMESNTCSKAPEPARLAWLTIVASLLGMAPDATVRMRWRDAWFAPFFQEQVWTRFVQERIRMPPLFVGSTHPDSHTRHLLFALSVVYEALVTYSSSSSSSSSVHTSDASSSDTRNQEEGGVVWVGYQLLVPHLMQACTRLSLLLGWSSASVSFDQHIGPLIQKHFLGTSKRPLLVLLEMARMCLYGWEALEHARVPPEHPIFRIWNEQILLRWKDAATESVRHLPLSTHMVLHQHAVHIPPTLPADWKQWIQPHWPDASRFQRLRPMPSNLLALQLSSTSESFKKKETHELCSTRSCRKAGMHLDEIVLDKWMAARSSVKNHEQKKSSSFSKHTHTSNSSSSSSSSSIYEQKSSLSSEEVRTSSLLLLNGMATWSKWIPPSIEWLFPVTERTVTRLLPYRDYALERDFLLMAERWLELPKETGGHLNVSWDGRGFMNQSFPGQDKTVDITSHGEHEIMFHTHPWQVDGRIFSPPSPLDLAEFAYVTLLQKEIPEVGIQMDVVLGLQHVYVSYATVRVEQLFGGVFAQDRTKHHGQARAYIQETVCRAFDPYLEDILSSDVEVALPALQRWQELAFEQVGIRMDVFSWQDIILKDEQASEHKCVLPFRFRAAEKRQ